MTNDAIRCEGLTKRFGSFAAVDAVDFAVAEGEAFGFIGPNGAGKTTAVRMLIGFLRPSSGNASVLGHDSWREQQDVRRLIGNLPGDFTFDARVTGSGLLELVSRLRGGDPSGEYQRRIDELAERLHCPLHKKLGELSRGNLQKVGLIQALFHRPRVLFLDEPTTGFDPLMQHVFSELVREAQADGTTVFLSSHRLIEVEELCTRVGMIKEGRLIATEQIDALTARALRHVRVVFEGAVPAEALGAVPRVSDLTIQGQVATLRCTGDLGPLLALLAGQALSDVTIQRASLEELFTRFYATGSTPEHPEHAPAGPREHADA